MGIESPQNQNKKYIKLYTYDVWVPNKIGLIF